MLGTLTTDYLLLTTDYLLSYLHHVGEEVHAEHRIYEDDEEEEGSHVDQGGYGVDLVRVRVRGWGEGSGQGQG
eukprot:scaffold24482_cov40-Phaeocystis_antarctica.AAC.2